MAKKKGKKKIWIVVLILVIAALAALLILRKGGGSSDTTGANQETEEVTRGTISITTEGNGSIEAAEKVSAVSDYAVKIDTVKVEDGDSVREGDVIATVDKDSVSSQITQLTSELDELNDTISSADKSGSSSVTAPVSGRVKRIYVKSGEELEDVLKDHGGIMELSTDGKLKVEFTSSETLTPGDTVTVSFLSYEEEGTIVSAEQGRYTATIDDSADYLVDVDASILNDDDKEIGSGTLKSNHPYLIEARYGIADEINVSTGDYVDSGSTLLTRTDYDYNRNYLDLVDSRESIMEDLQELRTLESSLQICAESDGIISDLALSDDTEIAAGTQMYQLISTDTFWLKTEIDELDIADVKVGQTAEIVFDAFEDESYEGTVKKVSALGENVGGVTKYQVTIEIPGVEKAKLAMSATATILINEKEDVLLVPVDAVSNVDGEKCVTVMRNGAQETVAVTLGLVNNTVAEVTEGLSEGDQVVVETSSGMEDMMSMMQARRSEMLEGAE